MRAMNILDQSIQAAGGVSALAKSLQVEPNVVSNWRSRGIPQGWALALETMHKHRDGVFSTNVTNVNTHSANIDASTGISS